MGDFGGPLLSTMESLSLRSKSGALHLENCQSPKDNIHDIHLEQRETSTHINMSQDKGSSHHAVDTPLQHSTANSLADATTPTSEQPSKPPSEQPKAKDFAAEASQTSHSPTSSSGASSFKPPTPIRSYRDHPRLWVDDGPEAGKEIAEWRQKFVPFFEEQTKNMTTSERTRFFDKHVEHDEERYCQPIAAYYGAHPEHLPERPVDPRRQKKIDTADSESPKWDMMQQKCFGFWNNWEPRATDLEPQVGPRGETTPDEKISATECKHCVKEAKKQKSLVRKVFRKFSTSKDKSEHQPTRRNTVAEKPCNIVIEIPTASDDDQVVDSNELASEHSDSSSDGRQREALTETGVGLTKSVTKKRSSVAQEFRLSTVHTR